MSLRWVAFVWVLGLWACQEMPTEPERAGRSQAPALAAARMTAPPLACTKSWTGAVDSVWTEPGNWSPSGAPGASDVACFNGSGAYASGVGVTTIRGLDVEGLAVPPWSYYYANIRLRPGDSLFVTDTLVLRHGGWLRLEEAYVGVGDLFINEGSISVYSGSPSHVRGDLLNSGGVSSGGPVTGGQLIWNADHITIDGGGLYDPYFGATFTAPLVEWMDGDAGQSVVIQARDFRWAGGDPEGLQLRTDVLRLDATDLTGTLDVLYADSILGEIGPGVTLSIGGGGLTSSYVFRRDRSGPPVPLRNEGTVTFAPGAVGSATATWVGGLVNRGIVEFERATRLMGGRLQNRGHIAVGEELRAQVSVDNLGTMEIGPGARLVLRPGTELDLGAGSRVTGLGSIALEGGRLGGTGTVGTVISTGGTLAPGAPYGTLHTGSLVLDAASRVEIEVAGTGAGDYDRIEVTGSVSLGGELRVTTVAPFQGGRCGQLVPVLTNSWLTTGQFQTVNGLTQGPQQAWRVHYGSNAVELAGYRLAGQISLGGSLPAVEEGGATGTYQMCLGTTAPTAAVEVRVTSRRGEVTATTPVTFDLADWMLPRTVSVAAIDDADVEGTHADTLEHTVATTDPIYGGTGVADQPVTVLDNDVLVDLALSLVSQQDNKFVGDTLSTTFRVTNVGVAASSTPGVKSLPLVGLEYVAATGASCVVDSGGALRCTLAPIASGDHLDFTLQLRAAAAGLHTNSFAVSGPELDPEPSNDTLLYTQRVN